MTPAPENPRSRESSDIFWPLCTCVHMHMYTNTDIHHTNRKTKIFLTSYKFHVDWLFGPLGYCGLRNVIFPTQEYGVCFHLFLFSSNVSIWISKVACIILLFIISMYIVKFTYWTHSYILILLMCFWIVCAMIWRGCLHLCLSRVCDYCFYWLVLSFSDLGIELMLSKSIRNNFILD